MQLKLMPARFPGTCKKCRVKFPQGETIYWGKGQGSYHQGCYSTEIPSSSNPVVSAVSSVRPTGKTFGQPVNDPNSTVPMWMIDWNVLRQATIDSLSGQSVCRQRGNNSEIQTVLNSSSGFTGYTKTDLSRWIEKGYRSEGFVLNDPPVPIREKRRLVFHEDDGEFQLDMALAGEDYFFTRYTKVEQIPGIAIEAELSFQGMVDAKILTAYFSWLNRAIFALDSAGIDCQVTLIKTSRELWDGNRIPDKLKTRRVGIRVKKENELVDFNYWSPMVSPAAQRGFGFIACCLYADDFGVVQNDHQGRGHVGNKWGVKFDLDRRVLEVTHPYTRDDCGYEFPEELMTEQLHAALLDMKKASN